MKTVVEIEWDQPEEENWLCPENIWSCLQAQCKNTKFFVRKINIVKDEEFSKHIKKLKDEVIQKLDKVVVLRELKK